MLTTKNSQLTISTHGKGTYEITDKVSEIIRQSRVRTGVATVFMQHTSASLIIYENADQSARVDLDAFFDRLAPENADFYTHTLEGSDDMPSHLRMVLTRSSEAIPIDKGSLSLGHWQGIFVYEHRRQPHRRTVLVNVLGDAQ